MSLRDDGPAPVISPLPPVSPLPPGRRAVDRGPLTVGPFDPDTWYLASWVAEQCGAAWQTWVNARNVGTPPTPVGTKIGRRLYFKGSDIADYLERCREQR